MITPLRLQEDYPAVVAPLELGAFQKALQRSKRGMYIVVINAPALRQKVRLWLEKMLARPIYLYVLETDYPLLAQLRKADESTPTGGILWVEGLESIPISALQEMNRQRSGLRHIGHPLVFCLPEFFLEQFQQNAADIFDWHRGLYELYAPEEPQVVEHLLALTPWVSLSAEERKRQISILEALQDEYQSHGDQAALSRVLLVLAHRYTEEGLLEQAFSLYKQALELFEALGDRQGKAATLHAMAYIHVMRGKLDRAMQLYRQTLEIHEALGDRRGKAVTIGEIAGIEAIRGNLAKAIELQEQKLKIVRELGDQREISVALHAMANVYVTRGELERAMQLYQQALEIKEALGDRQGKAATLHAMAYIHVTRGELERAMQLYQQSLEIDEALGDRQGKAMTLGMMAHVFWAKGERKQAVASLLGGLMQLAELRIEPQTQQAMAADLARWRQELGAEAFDALWRQVTGGQPLPEWLTSP